MERYCNYVLSIWNDVLKFVTGKIVNKMANDGMEEVRVSALAYMLRYDKRTLDKRGRRIRNIDFLTALRKSNAKYARMEVTHFSNTVNDGILYARKAEDFAKVFRDSFGDGYYYPSPDETTQDLCHSLGEVEYGAKLYHFINFRLPLGGDATWINTWSYYRDWETDRKSVV